MKAVLRSSQKKGITLTKDHLFQKAFYQEMSNKKICFFSMLENLATCFLSTRFYFYSPKLIILETFILMRQSIELNIAIKTALGMSLISMISMELAMNLVDYWLTGGAKFVLWVLPISLFFGFITPWPYNYWRLKKLGKACH